jgi:hypothetical protein
MHWFKEAMIQARPKPADPISEEEIMSCVTNCCKKLSLTIALLAVAILATTASAQTCLQEEYNQVQKQKLNCTANDVRIAKVTNIRDPLTGLTLNSCIGGSHFNFLADFEILTTSSQARENIGLYIATNSTTQALTGSCVDNIISPQHQCPNAAAGIQCGSDNYHETDAAPDNCGDTSSNDNSTTFGSGAEKVTLEIDNFLCQAPAGSNQLVLPNCTSWQIPGGTIQCVSPAPTYPYPFNGPGGTPTAIPGSPSKCNCGIIPLAITVQSPSITVQKTCNTVDNTQAPDFSTNPPTPNSCTIHPEGGTVTYTVNVTNTSNFGSIVVDQYCDSAYGNVFTDPSFAGPACAAGTVGTISSTTCSAFTVASGASQTCTFTANQAENVTVNNIVNVKGHGASNGSFGPTASNQVTVVSNEAPTSGTITKTFVGNTAGCATVRYNVDVANTSASGTDETLNLSAFNDTAFGSITSVHDSVLGTTCGVASGSPGLGSLSGSTGGGALPATITVGGTYSCKFDGQFCSGLDANGCFTHSNTVSATVKDDENATVSLTPGDLTVKECLVGSVP